VAKLAEQNSTFLSSYYLGDLYAEADNFETPWML
jgi:hypothetical protein